MGGSFVFDTKAFGDDDWPHRVERALQAQGFARVRVINAGTPGHTTFDSVGRLLSEIRFFEPDVVVLCHAWNDMKYFNRIDPVHTPLRVIEPLPRATHARYPPSWFQNAFDHLALFRLARALPRMFGRYGEEGRMPEGAYADTVSAAGIAQYRVNAACFVDVCRNIGALPVLCTQPHLPTSSNREAVHKRVGYYWVLMSHEAVCRAFQGCEESLRDVAREKGCPLIDLAGRFSGEEALFVDHVHLNRQGSEAIAAGVAEELAGIVREAERLREDAALGER
jgi:lysophospholipase L1-like esterase